MKTRILLMVVVLTLGLVACIAYHPGYGNKTDYIKHTPKPHDVKYKDVVSPVQYSEPEVSYPAPVYPTETSTEPVPYVPPVEWTEEPLPTFVPEVIP